MRSIISIILLLTLLGRLHAFSIVSPKLTTVGVKPIERSLSLPFLRLREGAEDDELLESIMEDDDYREGSAPLYNPVPLVSGVIITLLSVFLSGYGMYAGLSGSDPLFGQY